MTRKEANVLMSRILIVEDDESLILMLEIALRPLHHEVIRCLSGADVLPIMRAQRPDLVILDLMMPAAGGDSVLAAIRADETLRDTPVIVLSAHPKGESIAAGAGADTFLGKPVDIRIFRETVTQLLNR